MKNSDKKIDFSVPEGYFENASRRFLSKIEDKHHKTDNDGFILPPGYFEALNGRIVEKINKQEIRVVQLHPFKKYYYAAAVAAILILFFGIQFIKDKEPTFGFDDLAYSDIETYFESNKFGITSYEIAEIIPVDQLEINDILTDRLNEEIIIEYLNNNTDSLYELNLENDE